ncbi:MAG TPA: hypothetical protein VE442_19110 [Jatrophihabitans sp.]|nr:hypothetical protein [Jatrophihabitans sp.]
MAIAPTNTAAAARPRTLSAQWSPNTLLADQVPWRLRPIHNSIPAALRSAIVQMADVTPVGAGSVYGAAKQAGPPRGVPR